MTSKSKGICKLCLKAVQDNNYKTLDGDDRQILEVLLLQVVIESSEQCVVCTDCLDMLQKCFEFKSCCVDVEDYISPFIKSGSKIDIGWLLQKAGKLTVDNGIKLCRLCMDVVKVKICKRLDQNESQDLVDDIRNCLPELNVSAVFDPLICEKCTNCLRDYSNFQKKCRDSNRESKNFNVGGNLYNENIESNGNFNRLGEDALEKGGSNDFGMNIKREAYEMYNATSTDYIKSEDIDTKDEHLIGVPSTVRVHGEIGVHSDQAAGQSTSDVGDSKANIKKECKTVMVMYKNSDGILMYKCSSCDYETKTKYLLIRHMIVHTDPSERIVFRCDVCDFTTTRKECLKTHRIVHKNSSEASIYKCDDCGFETKWKHYLKKHQSTSDTCGDNANNRKYYEKHMRMYKDASGIQMYKCSTCNYETKNKHLLIRHMNQHLDPSERKTFKCDECGFKTYRKDCLQSHRFMHKNVSELVKYKCDECGFETKRKYSLQKHLAMHKKPPISMHKCLFCNFTTKNIKEFTKHKLTHLDTSEKKTYKCDLCEFTTNFEFKLQSHTSTSHKSSYKAQKRGPKTTQTYDLTHMSVHKNSLGTKIYKCNLCNNYESKYKCNVNQHLLKHIDQSENKLYKCDVCHFTTDWKCAIERHRLLHKDSSEVDIYKCNDCDFSTKWKSSLLHHVLNHKNLTALKMHTCPTCNYTTNHKTRFERHKLKHLKKVKYRCEDTKRWKSKVVPDQKNSCESEAGTFPESKLVCAEFTNQSVLID